MKRLSSLVVLFVNLIALHCQASVFHHEGRVYIDRDDFEIGECEDQFWIHTGNNIWISTHSIQRDSKGLFAWEACINKDPKKGEYEKTWKCPYCYQYWPLKTPCQNPDCPSKYK